VTHNVMDASRVFYRCFFNIMCACFVGYVGWWVADSTWRAPGKNPSRPTRQDKKRVSGIVDVTNRIILRDILTTEGDERCTLFREAFRKRSDMYEVGKKIVRISICGEI